MQETEHLVRYNLLLLLLFLSLFSGSIFAQNYPDPVVDSLLKSGINKLLLQDYDQARNIFEELNKKYPELPLGKIYLVGTSIARSYDYKEPYNSDYINDNLDTAETIADRLYEKDPDNIWHQCFVSLRAGYYAYYEALERNWLSAFSNGINSVKGFEKCLAMNPEFYEAYAAIGGFKYWRSRKTESLKWLPFIKDEREEGIKYLKKAVEKATYTNYMAVNSLLWIYIDQKKYQDAINLAEKMLNEYPDCRYFLWPEARAYEGVDKRKAISLYEKILSMYKNMKNNNHYNEIVLEHIIARQYAKLSEKQKALRYCNEILSITNLSDFVKDKLGDRLEHVQDLKKELSGQ